MKYYETRMNNANAALEWKNTALAIDKEFPGLSDCYKYPVGAGWRCIERHTKMMRMAYQARKTADIIAFGNNSYRNLD